MSKALYQHISAYQPISNMSDITDMKLTIKITFLSLQSIAASISDIWYYTDRNDSISVGSVCIKISITHIKYHLVSLNHNNKVHINIRLSPNLRYHHYRHTTKTSDWSSPYHRSRPKNTTWPWQRYRQTQVPTGDVITIIIHSRYSSPTRSQLSTWVIKQQNPQCPRHCIHTSGLTNHGHMV